MISRWSLAMLAGCWLAANVAAQSVNIPRTDALGDQLPDGAIARLGTLRLKHAPAAPRNVCAVVFSPDGKRFASLDDNGSALHVWDFASGKEILGAWNHLTTGIAAVAFSPDGATLAAGGFRARFREGEYTGVPMVYLYDMAGGRETRRERPGHFVNALAFTDGGKTLVIAGTGTVTWLDLINGRDKRSWKPFADETRPAKGGGTETKCFDRCALSPDARALAVHVVWWKDPGALNHPVDVEANDHETVGFDVLKKAMTWRAAGKYAFNEKTHFAFSMDGQRVAVAMGPDQVGIRDAQTGKLIAMRLGRLFTRAKSISSLALSSNGKTAILAGDPANIILWNTDEPTTARGFDAQKWLHLAHCLQFSPDNKTLAVGVGNDITLYDSVTLTESHPFEGHHREIAFLAFTRDGSRIVTGGDGDYLQPREIVTWDARTWRAVQRTSVSKAPRPNVGKISPDQSVYVGMKGDDRFALFAMASGKLLTRFDVPADRTHQKHIEAYYWSERPEGSGFFSPSGKFYVLDRQDNWGNNVEGVYAVPSGKLMCLLPSLPPSAPYRFGGEATRPIAFSPDERLVAVFGQDDGKIYLCDIATGKAHRPFGTGWNNQGNGPQGEEQRRAQMRYFAGHIEFSHDGTRLASWTTVENVICVWEVATGTELQRLVLGEPQDVLPVGFPVNNNRVHFTWSADNRVLAVAEKKIQLWELASGSVRLEWRGHGGAAIRALTCSPDGRLLASGSSDTTVLIWDTLLVEQALLAAKNSAAPLTTSWRSLAEGDAAKGLRAIRALTTTPAQSVAWIREQVQPARRIEVKHIADLIGQLDNNQFKVRQRAVNELIQIGKPAMPAIDKVLAGSLTLETRSRLEEVRKRVSGPILSGKSLQAFRAVEVLERIGTPLARQVLQSLADGAPGALVTMEAQEALARLKRI